LLAAGALALMRKAGHRPATPTVPLLAPAPPELLPAVGPKGTDHLHQMLVNSLHLELLPDYLTRLAGRDLRVPPSLLVPLLHHATRSTETRAALGPVLGARGHWLAGINPEWAKLADSLSTPTDDGAPSFDRRVAEQLAALDIPSFACTPAKFPELMAKAIQGRKLEV
jgi:hypothetical protein